MDLTYCRLCLELSKHEFTVFDLITTSNDGCLKISEMIYCCVNLMIKQDDNLIHNICDPCINDVIRCYNFRKKCHESDKLLNMKIGGILNEHSDVRIKIKHEEDLYIPNTSASKFCIVKKEFDPSNLIDISETDTNQITVHNPTSTTLKINSPENKDTFLGDMASPVSEHVLVCADGFEENNDDNKINEDEFSSSLDRCNLNVDHPKRKKLSTAKRNIKGKREHKCTVCLKDFKNVTLLRLHSELHSEHNNYLCGICGEGFKQKQCLRAHNVRKHTVRFKCHICYKTYVGNSQLLAHMRGHTGEKPFSCEICGAAFGRKYSVEIHMRTHTGERPFKCRYCDKTFIMHSHRRNHEINHMDPEETEKFSCVVCLKTFKRKDLYNLHLKVHSEERNEKCKYCSKNFKSRKSLSSHIRHIHKAKKEE